MVAASPILLAGAAGAAGAAIVAATCAEAAPGGYAPMAIDTAYGVTPLLDRGIDGAGETVLVPELFTPGSLSLSGNATDIRQDLARFDSRFHLPEATLEVDSTVAGSTAPYNADYEEVEDVEVLHAVAPKAPSKSCSWPRTSRATGGASRVRWSTWSRPRSAPARQSSR